MKSVPDILLIDKPSGISSFDCIRILRRKIGKKKMGHAGTLDPLASGLMLIGVEEGTKQLTNLIGLPKAYKAEVLVGVSTTTGDLEGEITALESTMEVSIDSIKKAVSSLEGVNSLPVPLYSAVKIDGKPLYRYARSGIPVKVPVREMKVNKSEIASGIRTELFWVDGTHVSLQEEKEEASFAGVLFEVLFDVESGVYIRSLIEEIGKKLNIPATLFSLRRTSIGDFHIKDALGLDEIFLE